MNSDGFSIDNKPIDDYTKSNSHQREDVGRIQVEKGDEDEAGASVDSAERLARSSHVETWIDELRRAKNPIELLLTARIYRFSSR